MRRIGQAMLFALAALAGPSPATAQDASPGRVYTSDLVTRWGKAVTPDNAWHSYPRPQMRRPAWLNLNGRWEYAIRPKAAPQPAAMDGAIVVRFAA